MYKLLALCCIAAAYFSCTEAATGDEVFSAINTIGSEIRYNETLDLLSAIKESSASATTPAQWICIRSQIPLGYKELNRGLGMEQDALRREYALLTPEELELLELSSVQEQIRDRLTDAVPSSGTRITAIRGCVQ